MANSFAVVSFPGFSGSMLTTSFPASFPFLISLSAASTFHAMVSGLHRGLVVLLLLGRCHIILSRIILFVRRSNCIVCIVCI